jgi:hypothetical protein
MKRFIYFLTTALLIVGCCDMETIKTTTVSSSKEGIHIPKHATYFLYKFSYQGHDYLLFKGHEQMAVEHDPNCPCHESNNQFSIY